MKIRKNFKNLDANERRKFVEALNILKDRTQHPSLINPASWSRYEDFVVTHLNAMAGGGGWAHGDSSFFPWHREMIYQLEVLIQSIPGYEEVTIPYWDWTRDQDNADPGFPFVHTFIGVDGDDSDGDRVKRQTPAPVPYHPFDPESWEILANDPGGLADLRRAFGERGDAPVLPENDSVVTGVGSSFRGALASANYLTLRSRSEDIHNLVHRWVGGNMLRMTSPNDPVFYLHHCAIDRMWSLWQDKNPGLTHYQNTSGILGQGLNDNLIFNAPGETAPWPGLATPASLINGHTMHGNGVWYDTDLPEISLETPSVNFGNVPEGMTQYRAVRFRIQTARTVRFRITAAPTGNFDLTPMGTEFVAEPTGEDFIDGYVWVQFESLGGDAPQGSSLDIQAYIVDDEGYYAAAEGGEYTRADWNYNINITATKIPRVDNAVTLVLDRSGSMAANAGGSSTRSSLLRSAVIVFNDLLKNDDEIGIVSFDDLVDTLLPMTQKSLANVNPIANGNGLDPRGLTAIGAGIQQGRIVLNNATAGHQKAMIVLTDGIETATPTILDVAGDIDSRTYAIGFGIPSQINTTSLELITDNSGGQLVITGNVTTEEQRFLLAKYFIQVLAGISRESIVLDPQGELVWGAVHQIPFDLAETDISVDVITLCPIPEILDFHLISPQGKIIKPEMAAVEPNIEHSLGSEVVYYRMLLPAVMSAAEETHEGKWQAQLSLKDEKEISRMAEENPELKDKLRQLNKGHLAYNLIVKSFSNLEFEAKKTQNSYEPGAEIKLYASLREYNVPQQSSAKVVAELLTPKGDLETIALNRVAAGEYHAAYKTTDSGVYTFRIRANGATTKGFAFSREKVLTAGVYLGGNKPQNNKFEGGTDKKLCQLIDCLFSERVMDETFRKRLEELGINAKNLEACLKKYTCEDRAAKSKLFIPKIDAKLKDRVILGKAKPILADEPLGILAIEPARKVRQRKMPKAVGRPKGWTPFQQLPDEKR